MRHSRENSARAEERLAPEQQGAAARVTVERMIASREPVALFLDIDGTLLDVALTPSSVHVPPMLPELLDTLSSQLSGALAIITGRTLSEADRLMHPTKFVGAGVHGAQMRFSRDGGIESLTPSFDPALRAEIKTIVEGLPGVVLEDKGGGLALHYRLVPSIEPSLMRLLEALLPKYPGQFAIFGGRKVVEILPVGFSKGRALRMLAALPKFANRTPVMIGDDIADVEAFRAAEELGGFGLKVAGENFSKNESSFQAPAEVLDWLQMLIRMGQSAKS